MDRIKKPRGPGRRFRPGQTGNPGGRPKYSKLSHALREKLASPVPGDGRSYADVFAEILCDAGLRGDKSAIEMILQRTEGYPRQAIEFEDKTPPIEDAELLDRAIDQILDEIEASALAAKETPLLAAGDTVDVVDIPISEAPGRGRED